MQDVSRHNQRGYCKFGHKCHKYHNQEICLFETSCKDSSCTFRHRNACRYFKINGSCKFPECAYSHKESESKSRISQLETEIKDLKDKFNNLSSNMSEHRS